MPNNNKLFIILLSILILISLMCCAEKVNNPSINSEVTWIKDYNSNRSIIMYDLAIDSLDNIVVTGKDDSKINSNYYTIKYDTNGIVLWEKEYDSGLNGDNAKSVGVDSVNNIIVSGVTGNYENGDIYTIKYTPEGNILWAKTYSSQNPISNPEIGIDKKDNVFIVGTVEYLDSEGFPYDKYFLIKYDKNGKLIWDKIFQASGDDYWEPEICIDTQDNIIITCGNNLYVLKFNNNGNLIWKKNYPEYTLAKNIDIDSNNNLVILCYSLLKGEDKISNSHILKLNSEGNFMWANIWDYGWTNTYYYLQIDKFDNIIVSGMKDNKIYLEFHEAGNYFGEGVILGIKKWESVQSMSIDSNNNIIILTTYVEKDKFDYFIMKYTGYTE